MSTIRTNMPTWPAVPAFELEHGVEPQFDEQREDAISGAAIMAPLLETAMNYARDWEADLIAAAIARRGMEPELASEFVGTIADATLQALAEHDEDLDRYFVVVLTMHLITNGVTEASIAVNEEGKWLAVCQFVCRLLSVEFLTAAGYDEAADPYKQDQVAA